MSHLLTKLTIIPIAAFVFSLGINAALGGNPFNRIGYAVFVSVGPGIVTLLVFRVGKLVVTWLRVVTIYLLLFAMTIILQGLLRNV